MSLSPTVPLILAACWILPAIIITVLHQLYNTQSADDTERMPTSHQGIRAEVLQVDFQPRREAWREENWGGPGARVREQVTDSSHEVMVLVPFAEANVPVTNEDDDMELRQCSLCLN